MEPQKAPAGWYANPLDLDKMAFWDGDRWVFEYKYVDPTIKARKPVNRTLHLVLTIVTLGLWMPIWTIVLLTRLSEES